MTDHEAVRKLIAELENRIATENAPGDEMLNQRDRWMIEQLRSLLADPPPSEATPAVQCPECEGSGKSGMVLVQAKPVEGFNPTVESLQKLAKEAEVCRFCKGVGKVPAEMLEWRRIGAEWRERRKANRVGLREWAERVGACPSEYCEMENGTRKPDEKFAPPQATPAPAESSGEERQSIWREVHATEAALAADIRAIEGDQPSAAILAESLVMRGWHRAHGERVGELEKKLESLQRRYSAAQNYCEGPIAMRTKFDGNPPYVGWKGLGMAMEEAFDERDALRQKLADYANRHLRMRELFTRCRTLVARAPHEESDAYVKEIDAMLNELIGLPASPTSEATGEGKRERETHEQMILRVIAEATREVNSWPEWKQNILRHSASPTVSVPRVPVMNDEPS